MYISMKPEPLPFPMKRLVWIPFPVSYTHLILAYSGGLDTSVLACWLKETYDYLSLIHILPYHPVISVSGMNMVVTMVSICITLFCWALILD